MIEILEVAVFSELEQYKNLWNSLVEKSETNIFFMRYEYCNGWLKAFYKNNELLVLFAKKDGNIIGIAPLVITRERDVFGTKRVVRFLGFNQSDYMDLVITEDYPEVLHSFYSYLWSIRNRWDKIQLSQISLQSSTVKNSLVYLKKLNFPFSCRYAHPCAALAIAGHEEDIQTKLRKQRTLKTAITKLNQIGKLEYGCAKNIQDGLMYLDKYFQQHISRWDETLSPSTYYDEDPRIFYQELIKQLMPTGLLYFSYINLDGRPIALNVNFEYNGALLVHRSSFDPWYYKHSPGRLIFRYGIEYCLVKGLRDFDLLAGLESYKDYLINESRLNIEIVFFKSPQAKFWDDLKSKTRKSALFAPIFSDSWIWRVRMKLRKAFRLHGKIGTIRILLQKLLCPVLEVSVLKVFGCQSERMVKTESLCPIVIKPLTDKDISLIASFHGYHDGSPRIKDFEKRFQSNNIPYLALHELTPVHLSWICCGDKVELEETETILKFKENSGYIWDCKTFVLYRGKNIYPAVLQHIIRDISQKYNIKNFYIAVAPDNKSSIGGIRKAGFDYIGTIRTFKILGLKISSSVKEIS